LAVTYIRSTGEQAPATVIGRSTCGEDFIHLKHMRNGQELEHHASVDRVLFPMRSPSQSPSEAGSEASGTQGRSPTRSDPPPGSSWSWPLAPLPFGWELATTAKGTPYYLDHNQRMTTWERPELPPYPTAPKCASIG
jgi:hypothetical protein